ncbi:hypothetical protein ACWJVJ_14440 [Clostridioides difficile]
MEILNLFWGFILTIWNVNIKNANIIKIIIPSFILTIWNVNPIDPPITPDIPSGFILTIWNVNNELSKPRS